MLVFDVVVAVNGLTVPGTSPAIIVTAVLNADTPTWFVAETLY